MKLLLALLSAVLIKSLVWTFAVPVFQTPDEQAHFAQLQWYAEKKKLNIESKNLSLEVATAEEILGTRRDGQGNNKFTYHPQYKNNSPVPLMPTSFRTIYVDREAAGYPPLYYLTALPFYNAVYDSGLSDRLLASRLVSVIYSLLLVVAAYKIGKLVFESEFLVLSLAVLVGFHPMVSFVLAGFHPDNLLNLLYSAGLFILLSILKNGVKLKYLGILVGLMYLGLQTKILMIFLLPIAGAVIIYKFLHESKPGIILACLCLISPVVAILLLLPLPYMPAVTSQSPLYSLTLVDYLGYRLPKTLFETWPWFWGVFKWLGLTLPRQVMQVITRVTGLAVIGMMIYFIQILRSKKITFKFKAISFSLFSLLSYFFFLVLWDWRLTQSIGYGQGIQGRYFFPNITAFLIILLFGWKTLFGKWQKFGVLILVLGMIVLNTIALQTVINSYY